MNETLALSGINSSKFQEHRDLLPNTLLRREVSVSPQTFSASKLVKWIYFKETFIRRKWTNRIVTLIMILPNNCSPVLITLNQRKSYFLQFITRSNMYGLSDTILVLWSKYVLSLIWLAVFISSGIIYRKIKIMSVSRKLHFMRFFQPKTVV